METLFKTFLESSDFIDYMDYYEMISNNKKYAPNIKKNNPKIYSTIEYFLELYDMGFNSNIDLNNIYINTVPIILPKVIIKLEINENLSFESDLSEKEIQTYYYSNNINYDIYNSDDDDFYYINNYKQFISINGIIKLIDIPKRMLKEDIYDSYEEDNYYSDNNYLIDNEFSDDDEFE